MASSRTVEPLHYWQSIVETSLETGQASVLDMGAWGNALDNVAALVAFHAFANERRDLVAPFAVCGGHSLIWLTALMHSRDDGSAALSPEIRVVYSGADLPTHMASLAIYEVQLLPVGQGVQGVLPVSFAGFFDLAAQAGPVLWAALPFVEMTTRTAAPLAGQAATDQSQKWLTWIAVLISVGLVLSAMVV